MYPRNGLDRMARSRGSALGMPGRGSEGAPGRDKPAIGEVRSAVPPQILAVGACTRITQNPICAPAAGWPPPVSQGQKASSGELRASSPAIESSEQPVSASLMPPCASPRAPQEPGRISHHNTIIRDIPGNHAAHTDEAIVPDMRILDDGAVAA
jgi:hypothetical protein